MKSRRALSLRGPDWGAAGAGAGCAARCRGMGRLTALGGAAFTGGGVAITGCVSCLPASSLPAALCDAVRGGSVGAVLSTGGVPGGVTEGGIRARVGNGSDGVAAVVSGLAGGEAAGAAAGCDTGSTAAGGLGAGPPMPARISVPQVGVRVRIWPKQTVQAQARRLSARRRGPALPSPRPPATARRGSPRSRRPPRPARQPPRGRGSGRRLALGAGLVVPRFTLLATMRNSPRPDVSNRDMLDGPNAGLQSSFREQVWECAAATPECATATRRARPPDCRRRGLFRGPGAC